MNIFTKFVLPACAVLLLAAVAGNAANNDLNFLTATGGPPSLPPVILESGGPDAYGYYYYDSEDAAFNAPTYNWIDISAIGVDMAINSDDLNVGPFPIGFLFNFYGVDFISFRACSNGFVSFSSTSNIWTNVSIPTVGEPENLLAVFWDDLHPGADGHAYYYSNYEDTLIIAWHNFGRFSGEGAYTFEIIITADGNILYQYQSVSGMLDSHTIGIENSTGTIGLQYVYNTARDESGTAILFSLEPPDYGAKDILVVAADYAISFITEISGYDDIGAVNYFDGRYGTPSLDMLEEYDAVVVWSNYVFYDRVAMGDVLADYLDEGGAVTMLVFSFSSNWGIEGRVMTQYSPFSTGPGSYTTRALGEYDAGHPLMKGVSTLTEYFSANVALQNSPILVASYDSGTPLVAYNPVNNLVAINCYVGDDRQFTGDVINLCHNAIGFSADGPGEVLLIQADYGADLAKGDLRAFPDINSVHIYNGRFGVPSLELLQQYEAVCVWSNYVFEDAPMLGNRLADYVDMGGGVVINQFSFTTGWNLEGRLMDSYSPFGLGSCQFTTRNLGWYNPDSPLMDGVDAVTDYFMSSVSIEHGGVTVASWDDSTPFVAYNPDHDVVAINGYVGDDRECTGDMMVIVHNAINFVRNPTGVEDDFSNLPRQFNLAQNYPNPFNPTTIIKFSLPVKADVSLDIFNVLGQKVTALKPGEMVAGHHSITFNASEIGSGVYFYKLTAGKYTDTRKMTVLK